MLLTETSYVWKGQKLGRCITALEDAGFHIVKVEEDITYSSRINNILWSSQYQVFTTRRVL